MSETTATQRAIDQATDKTAIRPFNVNVPETELTELRRRIDATKDIHWNGFLFPVQHAYSARGSYINRNEPTHRRGGRLRRPAS